MFLLITTLFETQNFKVMVAKNMNFDVLSDAESVLNKELASYWGEVHYPDDEDIEVIRKDLTETLELEYCNVQKK